MWTIRRATISDIDTLVDLRTRFLEEIGYSGDGTADAVRDFFLVALSQDEFVAWVAEASAGIIAMGGLVYCQKVPHGRNLSGREGFILNMYTLPEWRGRGMATALMNAIVGHVRDQQITCIRLHATEDGAGIYSKLGFRSESTEMILDLTNTKFEARNTKQIRNTKV